MAQRSPRTLFEKIAQAAAGTDTLVTPPSGYRVVLKGIQVTMSAAGSLKIVTGATDKTGAFPVAANGGLVMPPVKDEAYLEGAVDEALKITTTTGAAKGCIQYELQKG